MYIVHIVHCRGKLKPPSTGIPGESHAAAQPKPFFLDSGGRLRWTLSAFLSTQKSPQKSKPTQKSTLESKSTFLSPQKSVQKSFIDQKSAQKSALLSDQLKKVLKKEWVTQKS